MATINKEDLLSYLSKNKEFFNDIFGVSRIGVFGSFARDQQKVSSDIDIVVEFEKGKKNIHNFLNFKRHLENKFGRRLDLGFEESLKPAVKEKIKRQIYYV